MTIRRCLWKIYVGMRREYREVTRPPTTQEELWWWAIK